MLYLPDIPEAAIANLAIWRIGAVSVPIYCSEGEKSITKVIDKLKPSLIITASCYVEGEKIKYLKQVTDNGRSQSQNANLRTLLIQRKFHVETESFNSSIDSEFDEEVEKVTAKEVDAVPLPSSHPSYIFSHKQQFAPSSFFVRDTAGLAVGVSAGLNDNYNVK